MDLVRITLLRKNVIKDAIYAHVPLLLEKPRNIVVDMEHVKHRVQQTLVQMRDVAVIQDGPVKNVICWEISMVIQK